MRLRPFFSFYGSKCRLAPLYPRPLHPRIIEPFAGGAGYSTYYSDHLVHLYDIDPDIAGVWDYLIRASGEEIRRLPIVHTTDDLPQHVVEEARHLIGLWFARCSEYPRTRLSSWGATTKYPHAFWSSETRDRIAAQVDHIRHWRIYNRSYECAPNLTATWFVDPPYSSVAGRSYRSGRPDFSYLANWSRARRGQVIVCEHNDASWLPFSHLHTVNSCRGKGKTGQKSAESVWVNTTTDDMR